MILDSQIAMSFSALSPNHFIDFRSPGVGLEDIKKLESVEKSEKVTVLCSNYAAIYSTFNDEKESLKTYTVYDIS